MAHSFYPPWKWRLWILLATTLSTRTFRHLCQLLLEWYGTGQAHRVRMNISTYHSSLFSCGYKKQPPGYSPYYRQLSRVFLVVTALYTGGQPARKLTRRPFFVEGCLRALSREACFREMLSRTLLFSTS